MLAAIIFTIIINANIFGGYITKLSLILFLDEIKLPPPFFLHSSSVLFLDHISYLYLLGLEEGKDILESHLLYFLSCSREVVPLCLG